MDLVAWNLNSARVYPNNINFPISNKDKQFYCFRNYLLPFYWNRSNHSITITHARKKIQPNIIQEVTLDDDELEDDFVEELEEDDLLITDDFDNDEFLDGDEDDGDYFEDEYATENAQVYVGDGAEGGGISLAGTWWDKEALTLAENVAESFDGEVGIYAFRTLANARIQIRIEKLSTKSSSPSLSDIEAFSAAYRTQLDEAELAKTIPENVSLENELKDLPVANTICGRPYNTEVSSPGVERVIRIPQELDRFKERPMYVKYLSADSGSSSENDGIFKLVSFNLDTECCTWGLADVRINREKAGKGRPMSKKMREWRVTTPFDSIILARLHSEM